MLSKISRSTFYPLLLLLLVIGSSNTAPTSTDCNGKDFICPDENTFLICVKDEDGNSRTVDSTPQNCPTGYYCDNNLENECSSSVPASAAALEDDQPDETVVVEETTQVEETVVIEKEVTENVVEEVPEPATTAPEDTETEPENQPEVPQENSEIETEQEIQETVQESEIQETESETEIQESVQEDESSVTENGAQETVDQGEESATETESDTTVVEETDQSEDTTGQQEASTEDATASESNNQDENQETEGSEKTDESLDAPVDESTAEETTEDAVEETSGDKEEESTPEAPPATVAPLVCNSIGKFGDPNDCRKYALCIWTPFGYRKFENVCALDQAYDPISKQCEDDLTLCDAYNRPTVATHEFQCTERGRFPDLDNNRKYYACLLDPLTGDFVQISLTCPILTVFNEAAQRCTLELFPGDIPSDETNNSNQSGAETDDHNTAQNENGAVEEVSQGEQAALFVCTEEGTFPDPADESRYFICKLKKKDKFKLKHKKCGKKKVFNPETLLCFDPTLVVNEETPESQENVSSESAEDQKTHQEQTLSE